MKIVERGEIEWQRKLKLDRLYSNVGDKTLGRAFYVGPITWVGVKYVPVREKWRWC